MADQIRIGIFDEHPLFRQGAVRTIERSPGMVVVAEGRNAQDACKLAASAQIDVVLIDISARGRIKDSTEAILAARPNTKVVILTASDDEEHLAEAIRSGAKGYILKGISGPELLKAVELIHKGEPYITLSLASRVLMQSRVEMLLTKKPDAEARIELTHREQQVLGHVTQGLTNMEIAGKLGVSLTVIKHVISDLFRKIRVRNRMEAVHVAQKLKLV